MQKVLIIVILEKIMQVILEKDSLSKSIEYIQHNDRSAMLKNILKYLKYTIIIVTLSMLILFTAFTYAIYYLFTHFN